MNGNHIYLERRLLDVLFLTIQNFAHFDSRSEQGSNRCLRDMMKALWSSVADVTIVQAQDLLGIGSEGRMNVPSTAENNWCWRAPEGSFEDALAEKLLHNMKLYGRC